ncbi:MAG: hypothetical protein GF331_08050 [Chitinivibrionales bacterium]|nr:hypothetical protein [Chitinivibrionales bacterium]
MATINVTGIAVVDALCGPIAQYPEPRVRTQVTAEYLSLQPGGGAVNTAATLAHLGIASAAFTKVGSDANGRFLVDTLAGYGVDTTGIRQSQHESTPYTFVGIHPDGDRTFIHTPGANLTICAQDLDTDRLYDCTCLMYQDCHVLPSLDGAPGAAMLREARRRGIVTLLDECWGMGPNREVFETMVAEADFALPSLDDMAAIYPDRAPESIAEAIRSLGPKCVVLKMGADGCLVCSGAHCEHVPAQKAEPVDTTGAGDSFDAGFVAALVRGAEPMEAARYGARVGAARVRVVGASGPIGAV